MLMYPSVSLQSNMGSYERDSSPRQYSAEGCSGGPSQALLDAARCALGRLCAAGHEEEASLLAASLVAWKQQQWAGWQSCRPQDRPGNKEGWAALPRPVGLLPEVMARKACLVCSAWSRMAGNHERQRSCIADGGGQRRSHVDLQGERTSPGETDGGRGGAVLPSGVMENQIAALTSDESQGQGDGNSGGSQAHEQSALVGFDPRAGSHAKFMARRVGGLLPTSTKHLDRFLAWGCAAQLLGLGMFGTSAAAQEVTESMAMLRALEMHVPLLRCCSGAGQSSSACPPSL